MSEPKTTRSGEYPAVQAYRKKLASIDENTLGTLQELSASVEADAVKRSEAPPPPLPDVPSSPDTEKDVEGAA